MYVKIPKTHLHTHHYQLSSISFAQHINICLQTAYIIIQIEFTANQNYTAIYKTKFIYIYIYKTRSIGQYCSIASSNGSSLDRVLTHALSSLSSLSLSQLLSLSLFHSLSKDVHWLYYHSTMDDRAALVAHSCLVDCEGQTIS